MWFLGTSDQPGDYRSSAARTAATSCTRMTAIPTTRAAYARFGHEGRTATADPDDSARRVGTPVEARVHARHSFVAVHGLPHASAQRIREQLLRLHDVGLRSRRARSCGRRRSATRATRSAGASSIAIPKAPPSPASGATPIFSNRCPSSIPRCATLSSPTITGTVGISARCSSATAKARCSINPARRWPMTIREIQESGAPLHSSRHGHALRRLPLRAGRARQRPHLRRGRRRHRGRLHRLSRHGRPLSAVAQFGSCSAAGRDRSGDDAYHRWAANASNGATASSISARRSIPISSGRSRW